MKNPLDRLTSGGWAKGLLRLSVGVVLVVVVLRFAGGDSWRHLRNPALIPLIVGGALIHLAQRCARVRKWQLMLVPSGVIQRPFSYLLRIQLIGMVANLALPVSEAVKVWAVSKDRIDARIGATSIVIDMAMHTALVGMIGIVSLLASGWWEPALWAVAAVMTLAPLAVIGVALRWPAHGAIAVGAPLLWLLAPHRNAVPGNHSTRWPSLPSTFPSRRSR